MWGTSVIFNLLPKVNNHPLGENSPNLVTLVVGIGERSFATMSEQLDTQALHAELSDSDTEHPREWDLLHR
jgi:hypothetical protein